MTEVKTSASVGSLVDSAVAIRSESGAAGKLGNRP